MPVRPTLFGDPIVPLRGAWGQPQLEAEEQQPEPLLIQPLGIDLTEDAPIDTGQTYGRLNGDWEPVVPLTGAHMEGPLYAYADPTQPHEVSTKHYVDNMEIDGGDY